METQQFIQNYREAFGSKVELPLLFGYSDKAIAETEKRPVATDRSNRFGVSVDGGKNVVCENIFKEWGREWKIQVLENRKDFLLTLPLSKNRREHIITLSILDPGQIIQKITYQ